MRKKSFRRTKTQKCKVQKFKLSFKTVKSLRLCTCEMMARNTHLLMSLFRQKNNRFNAKNRTNCASARNFAICKKCAQHTKPYRAKILENSHFVVWACACMTYNADQLCAVSYTDLCSTACLLLSTCFRRGFACIACASRHFLTSVNRFSCSFAEAYIACSAMFQTWFCAYHVAPQCFLNSVNHVSCWSRDVCAWAKALQGGCNTASRWDLNVWHSENHSRCVLQL